MLLNRGEPTGHLPRRESFKPIPLLQRSKILQLFKWHHKGLDAWHLLSYTNFLMSPSLQEHFVIVKFGLVPIKELHFLIVPWS